MTTRLPLVECVPNFSEGRDRSRVEQIVAAMAVDGVHLLDFSLDPDHNRSVVTVVGSPAAVVEAAVRGAGCAARLIDLTTQAGVHPRIGAADVIPFVPVRDCTLADCATLARQAGMQIWERFAVPVYFYGAAAVRPDRVALEAVRRGQFEGLGAATEHDSSRRPDLGGPRLHASAGASALGARSFLIAYNVYLRSNEAPAAEGVGGVEERRRDLAAARAVARDLRESSGGLVGVKALGLTVDGRAQVSLNVTDFRRTPLSVVHRRVGELARRHGMKMGEGELIGLIPEAAYEPNAAWVADIPGFTEETKVLERRIASPLPWPELPA